MNNEMTFFMNDEGELETYNPDDYVQISEKDFKTIQEKLILLNAYENTGLTPEEITDGKLLTGWISVEERLPPLDKDGYSYVLVCMEDGFITTTDYTRDEEFGLWADSGEVTHWMPLPKPPKEV